MFSAAEAKITDLESRIVTLEGADVDLTPILAEIDAIKTTQAAQAAELARLDSRLDAIAAAAGD
jgi:hypothetical protein